MGVPASAVIDPLAIAGTVRGAGQSLDLELRQPLRGKANHLPQQVGIGALLQKGAEAHHLSYTTRRDTIVPVLKPCRP